MNPEIINRVHLKMPHNKKEIINRYSFNQEKQQPEIINRMTSKFQVFGRFTIVQDKILPLFRLTLHETLNNKQPDIKD